MNNKNRIITGLGLLAFIPAILLTNFQLFPLLYKETQPDKELIKQQEKNEKLKKISISCLLGSSKDMIVLAEYYKRKKLYSASESWLLYAAEQNSPFAMYLLSKQYSSEGRKEDAALWLNKALKADKRLKSKAYTSEIGKKS